jgi:acyl dehydratase
MTVTAGDLSPAIVGAEAAPLEVAVDARWLMAYAAAVGLEEPRYFDTTAAGGPVAHPLFPVAYEWPAALALRARTIPDALAPLAVHATHHLVIHRLPRAGDRMSVRARVTALRRRRAGALVVTRFDAQAGGAPVTTTTHGTLYRGVGVTGEAGVVEDPAPADEREPDWEAAVPISPTAAHVYTECARIWNPIHTDVAVARAAGLPAPILHGTATLALAVSRVVERALDGDPTRVAVVDARFTGMVVPPATVVVRGCSGEGNRLAFDAVVDGRTVVSRGGLWPRPR